MNMFQLQRVVYDYNVLHADRSDEFHLRDDWPRVVGESEHWRMYAEATGAHQIQKTSTYNTYFVYFKTHRRDANVIILLPLDYSKIFGRLIKTFPKINA